MAQNASTVAQQQAAALDTILEVLARHDEGAAQRIDKLFQHGARKWSPRSGVVTPQDELMTVLCEAVATLAKTVDQQVAVTRPRPRGRPRKQQPAR